MKEKEEITIPPGGAWAPCLSSKQQGRALPQRGAPFLQRARPPAKGRAPEQPAPSHLSILQLNFPPPPHMAWNLLIYLHHLLIHPPPSYQGHGGTTYPSTPFGMESSVAASWPRYGLLTTSQAVTLNPRSQWSLFEFGNRLNCEEICIQKISCFKRRKGAFCTGLPDGLPIKENLGDPVVSLQPAIDTATPFVDTTWTTPSGYCMLNQ